MEHQDLSKLKVSGGGVELKFSRFVCAESQFTLLTFFLMYFQIAELRELLKAKGLRTVGNKQELIDRLQLSFETTSGDLDLTKLEDELLNVSWMSGT